MSVSAQVCVCVLGVDFDVTNRLRWVTSAKNAAVLYTLGILFFPLLWLVFLLVFGVFGVRVYYKGVITPLLCCSSWRSVCRGEGWGGVRLLFLAASFPHREFRGNEYKWRLRPLFNYFLITREQCGSFIFTCVCLTALTLSRECFWATSSAICLSLTEPPKVQKTQKSDTRCFSCFSGNFSFTLVKLWVAASSHKGVD